MLASASFTKWLGSCRILQCYLHVERCEQDVGHVLARCAQYAAQKPRFSDPLARCPEERFHIPAIYPRSINQLTGDLLVFPESRSWHPPTFSSSVQGPFDIAPGYGREVCLSSETSGRVFGGDADLPHCRADLVIGRHGAVLLTALRLRVGLRHRNISRTGRPHERVNPLKMRGCFTPSRGHRGAIEERCRPFGDPFRVKRPVSEGRMALPTPFETKRKKAPIGAPRRIQYLNVAERQGFEPWVGANRQRFSRPPHSTTLPPLRAQGSSCGTGI